MLRLVGVGIAAALLTLALLPLQWIAITCGLRARSQLPVLYHRAVCALLGVRVRLTGTSIASPPLLIVANHVSWLDIPVLASLTPLVFVAKREVAAWPVIGLLARLQRTIFVDRSRRRRLSGTARDIAAHLATGERVVLFAEGTSSDGNRVLTFRSSLLAAVQEAPEGVAGKLIPTGAMLQPLSIAYTGLAGLPCGRLHRPALAWYGDFDLLPHLAGVIRRGAIDVTVSLGEPLPAGALSGRKSVTRLLEAEVRRMSATAQRAGSSGDLRPFPASQFLSERRNAMQTPT